MAFRIFIFFPLFLFLISSSPRAVTEIPSEYSKLSNGKKAELIQAFKDGACEFEGIKLYGRVRFVTSFPDIKIKYVDAFPDLRVEIVSAFPDTCGKWQVVESFPDFTVQVVTSFPDLNVQKVTSFPGIK